MKIVHVCPFFNEQMGGTERYVHTLSRVQSKQHDVCIITTTRQKAKVGVSIEEGCTIHRLYSPTTIWNINPLAYLIPTLRRISGDVFHIHSHLYFTSNQAALANHISGNKSLLHIHGGVGIPPYETSMKYIIMKQLYDRTLGLLTIKLSDLIASVSRSDLHSLRRQYHLPKDKMKYIPNVIDTQIFTPKDWNNHEDVPTFLYVGDLEAWKGINVLIDWIKKMAKIIGSRINWVFVGFGSYYNALLKLKHFCELNNPNFAISVLNEREHSEIPSIMKQASALVFTSFWEGLPTVVLEAMASGIPVVSTNVGDLPFILSNMENAIIIRHTFESFRNAIQVLMNDFELMKRMGKNARKTIERSFTMSQVGPILEQAYSDLVNG